MSSEIRRLRYVCSGLSQFEANADSCDHREPDTSAIRMHDFVAESSDETPFERFLVWDPVEDSNVLYARPATAEAIRRNAVAAAALNALPGSDEGEGDVTEAEQDDKDDVEEEESNDDGDDNGDDNGADDDNSNDMGGIRIERK